MHKSVNDHADLITEAADSLMNLEHYKSALKYYLMLEGSAEGDNVRKMMLDMRTICIFLAYLMLSADNVHA